MAQQWLSVHPRASGVCSSVDRRVDRIGCAPGCSSGRKTTCAIIGLRSRNSSF